MTYRVGFIPNKGPSLQKLVLAVLIGVLVWFIEFVLYPFRREFKLTEIEPIEFEPKEGCRMAKLELQVSDTLARRLRKVFGDDRAAIAWLFRPNPHFHDNTPIAVIESRGEGVIIDRLCGLEAKPQDISDEMKRALQS